MASTYEPIASQTLGSDTATVTFSSISSNYTDLVAIVASNNDTGTVYGLRMRVGNGSADSGSNYSFTILYGDGSSAAATRSSNQVELQIGNTATSTDAPALSIVQIMSYANTNVYKTALTSVATSGVVARNVGLWRSTSAIDTVSFFSSTGDLQSGSTFSLYGIKAA